MSNVLERYRNVSSMEFYNNAKKLRNDMSKFLLSDKNVPKKWRAPFSYVVIGYINKLIDNIRRANRIYPRKDENILREKLELQSECIEIIDEIYDKLQWGIDTIWYDTLNKYPGDKNRVRIDRYIEDFSSSLAREESLIKGWISSTKDKFKNG